MHEMLAEFDWILLLPLVSLICQMIGKAIPDDAQGFMGLVRKGAKILGLYVNNRVTKTTTVADPARAMSWNR